MFDLRQFASLAPDWYLRLNYHEQLDSTNDEARRLAEGVAEGVAEDVAEGGSEDGAEHGTVVLADHQLAGRGRRGASWISGSGDGLLFSLILRPDFAQNNWSRIALAAGLGIVTALNEKWAVGAQVKWPNDIYLRGRKCAGILAEAREGFVVVGVGLNVIAAPGAGDSGVLAIALSDVLRESVTREMVLATVLDGIMREVECCGVDFEKQLSRLREVCYLTGKSIEFSASGNRLAGFVHGIGEDGALIVEVDGLISSYAQAAEIRVV